MVHLRAMNPGDLPLFQKWLSTPHVSKWYRHPSNWIDEIEKQDGAFRWIHHFIVEREGEPIGFCQYYACGDSDEKWEGSAALGGSYSIDYLIGEAGFLRKGLGKEIVATLAEKIRLHRDAKRIVVQPEPENLASCKLLLSCGFILDAESGIYVKEFQTRSASTDRGQPNFEGTKGDPL